MKIVKTMGICLALTLMSACGTEEVAEVEYTPLPTPAPSEIAETMTATISEPVVSMTDEEYLASLTFLGDSTTYGLGYYDIVDDTQVWTPASGTLTLSNQSFATIVYPATGEEISIRDAVERDKPEALVITLGVNGVSFLTEDGFKAEYKSLVESVQEISPETAIICNSIYPVQSDYQYIADINNSKITAANGWIKAVASETGTAYLDTYPLLLDSTGHLNPSYGNGDGIHLGTAGFEIVIENLMTTKP